MTKEDKSGSSPELYSKGNEAFVADDYKSAADLYTAALAQDPQFTDCMVARAHAYIKLDRFQDAKKDADRAIDTLRATEEGKSSIVLAKAFLRSGVSSFHLGRYREAKNCFAEGQKLGEEPGLKQWMSWCDQKIEKFGDIAPGAVAAAPTKEVVKVSTLTSLAQEKQSDTSKEQSVEHSDSVVAAIGGTSTSEVTGESKADGDNAKQLETGPAPSVPVVSMPVPKIKHDWYQTETNVIIEIRIKNMKKEAVQVEISEKSLSVTAKLPSGSDYSLELDLAHPVNVESSSHRVMSTKIEVKLVKKAGVRWGALEGEGAVPLATPSSKPTTVAGPYSSGKDWNRVASDLEKEIGDEKAEGEAALNEMFQKIYADSSDEVKKAMNKSFSESGGTVLSTNWSEIGKEKVDVKPPDGMEWKQWD